MRLATFGRCILFCSGCFIIRVRNSLISLRAAFSTSVFPLLVSVVVVLSVNATSMQLFRVFLTVFKDRFQSFGSLSFLKSFN